VIEFAAVHPDQPAAGVWVDGCAQAHPRRRDVGRALFSRRFPVAYWLTC
jgi:hypothetical protein